MVQRVALIGLIAVATGCAVGPRHSTTPTVLGSRPGARSQVAFGARLAGPMEASDAGQRPTGSLTLTFRDETHFEYDLIIRDGGPVTWVSASLIRVGSDQPVVVLAGGVVLRGAYTQVRGTGTMDVDGRGASLLERLRSRPADFEVHVASDSPGVYLSGSLTAR